MECLSPYLCMYGDCTSYNGQIRDNVGLARFHCNSKSYGHTCIHTYTVTFVGMYGT